MRKVHRATSSTSTSASSGVRTIRSSPLSVVETLAGHGVNVSSLAGQAIKFVGAGARRPSLRVERAEDFEVLGLRKGSSPWPKGRPKPSKGRCHRIYGASAQPLMVLA